MTKHNKAHTATANRISKRYGATYEPDRDFDIICDDFVIEVETTATISSALDKLSSHSGLAYIAVTNREGLQEALRLAKETTIGVMDPQGDIVKEAGQ